MTPPTSLRRLLPAAGLLLAVASSNAARPLVTDDTGTLDRGACELEAVVSRDTAQGLRVNGQSLQLGCGVGHRTQVALAVDRAKEEDVRARSTTLAAKTAIVPGDDASWSISTAVLWASVNGQGNRHAATALNLLHTRSLGPTLTLHANLGHGRDQEARASSTTWGIALEHAGWGPVAPMGELYGDDRSAPWWNLGLRWTAVPDRLTLDVAWGRQIAGGRPTALSAGLKVAF